MSRKPAKTRHGETTRSKRSNAPTAARQKSPSVADLKEKLDARTRELNEAIERENASAEVLRVISSSPGELDAVFKAILANATRLCDANFGILYQCDGDVFQPVALQDAVPAYGDYLRREPPRAAARRS